MRATLSLFLWTLMLTPAFSSLGAQTQSPLSNEQRWKTEHEAGMKAIEQAQASLLQGNLATAEGQFQQALAIYEKAGEPGNPHIAMVLNGLATVQRLRGNYGDATVLSRRSLAILEKAYGAEHPNVAIGQNNLAMVLRLRG